MIVSGGTDAGKTTLLRALAAEADPADRIVTIELSYELGLHELPHRHPDCVGWETREANTEGQGAVSMDYLVQRANRHDADRVIVGEVLGDEIVPMLNAMTAGKAGSMCTIHADSTEGTFGKIKTYASQSPKHLSDDAAAQLTAQALDLVIFVRKRPDASGLARRYVSSVRVVEDADGPHVISTEIFAEPEGGGPAVLHLGMPPGLRERLADVGYEAPIQRCSADDSGRGPGRGRHRGGPRPGHLRASGRPAPRSGAWRMTKRLDPANRQAALCAVALALIVGLITRWPVGAAIGGAVGWTLRSALQPNTSRRVTGRLEALATWIEALRDSIAAHRGLLAAIESTVQTAPPSIRDNVAALVVRIKGGVALDAALYTFADELGDAAVDEAVAPLILASRFGGSDLQSLLATAAANTRDQIALWQRIEIARAKPRRDMRLVIAVTLVFTLGVLLVGHGYFKPFGTPIGQIVLLAVAGLFAAGFAAMNRLSRPQPMPRLFGTAAGNPSSTDPRAATGAAPARAGRA